MTEIITHPSNNKFIMGRKQRHSSSSQPSGSQHDSRMIVTAAMAKELKPEHKLPNEKLLVKPKPSFMRLLATIGAQGRVFTSQQILQFLIKYIEGLNLYDTADPRKVYCEKDELGAVFGVKMFTIKDVRKLIFDNVDIVSSQMEEKRAGDLQQGSLQQQHQHSHLRTSGSASGSNAVGSTNIATAVDECDAPVKIVPHSVGKRTRSESTDSRCSKKRSIRSASASEDEPDYMVPWYTKKYAFDDLATLSSDQQSIQDKATAVITNSLDDLWFLDEDQLEFEIESVIASDSYSSFSSSGDSDCTVDKLWECNDCGESTNPLLNSYCMGCWAKRKGWLADEKRLSMTERLTLEPRRLSISLSPPNSQILNCPSNSSDDEDESDSGNDRQLDIQRPTVSSSSTLRLEPLISVGSEDGGIGRTSSSYPASADDAPTGNKNARQNTLCTLCLSRTKNASIIHGKTAHQVSCRSCAKNLQRHGKPCPVRHKKIQHVVKNYFV